MSWMDLQLGVVDNLDLARDGSTVKAVEKVSANISTTLLASLIIVLDAFLTWISFTGLDKLVRTSLNRRLGFLSSAIFFL